MRLERLFILLCFLLTLTVVGMTASVMVGTWRELQSVGSGYIAFLKLKKLLTVAEMVSRERGPSNAVLGSELPAQRSDLEKLKLARARSDKAFDDLTNVPSLISDEQQDILDSINKVLLELKSARQAVDAVSLKARTERSEEEIRTAIEAMIKVVSEIEPIAIRLHRETVSAFPAVANVLLAARHAAVAREIAGQVGSYMTVSIAKQRCLSTQDSVTINRLRGRLEQLRVQLANGITESPVSAGAREANSEMQKRFFLTGIRFLEQQEEIGLRCTKYSLTTAEFAEQYVPQMDSILNLRDELLREVEIQTEKSIFLAKNRATGTAIGCTIAILLLTTTWTVLNRRVIQPLREITKLIVTVAQGKFDVTIPKFKHDDEIAEILNAMHVLRDNSIARQQAEESIRRMAFYDRLTDLPNRRLLEKTAKQVFAGADRSNSKVGVLFIDLDKFKQVNDSQGHETGDWLLKQVAVRIRSILRDSDVAARVGGDEFVVLLSHIFSLEVAVSVAEKICSQLAEPFIMNKNVTLNIGASVGLALYPDHGTSLRELLSLSDQAMYKSKKSGGSVIATPTS